MRKTKKNQSDNILLLVENVIKSIQPKSKSSLESKIKCLDPELAQLSKVWGIPKESSFLFSIIFSEVFKRNSCSLEELTRVLGCDIFELIRLQDHFDTLVKSGFILRHNSGFRDSICWRIPSTILSRLLTNQSIERSETKNLSNVKFYRFIHQYFVQFDARHIGFDELLQHFKTLFELNPNLPIPQYHLDHQLTWEDTFFLLYGLGKVWHEGNNEINLRDFLRKYDRDVFGSEIYFKEDLDEETLDFNTLRQELQSGASKLLTLKVIQPVREGEYKKPLVYEINQRLLEDVFFKDVDVMMIDSGDKHTSDLIDALHPNEIKPVNLIYDKGVEKELNSFKDYFMGDNLNKVMSRYEELGIQSNFVCALFGPSGSGKSEWIKQLGRDSGRTIFNVDLGKIKDAYVGESEKNVLSIFKFYQTQVERVMNRGGDKEGNRIPLLVINEVDALMNNRAKFIRRGGVEQMLQSMINLLLLMLEELMGVVLMTTNCDNESLIDPAFSRRINHKIFIPNPSVEVRGRILHSVLGQWYTESDCTSLGKNYALTGGMVKNIHQKVVSHYVLKGSIPNLETLDTWCMNEAMGFGMMNVKSAIGFKN